MKDWKTACRAARTGALAVGVAGATHGCDAAHAAERVATLRKATVPEGAQLLDVTPMGSSWRFVTELSKEEYLRAVRSRLHGSHECRASSRALHCVPTTPGSAHVSLVLSSSCQGTLVLAALE